MKLFYQYSNCKTLEPITGDRISEIMTIKAMKNAGIKVIYGEKPILRNHYDLAYIRASENFFDKCLGLKRIWFASPYNFRCMMQADKIATFTDVWTTMLKVGTEFNLNPDGKQWGNKVITIPQTIEPMFFNGDRIHQDKIFNVCVTGRLTTSTYPKN